MRIANFEHLAWTVALGLAACAPGERRFPLREPMWHDADMRPVSVPCHVEPSAKDPRHVACAPEPFDAPLYWDGADELAFRPLSETTGIAVGRESIDVNSLDEVPNSSWFTNRLGVRPMSLDELRKFSCSEAQLLDPDHSHDGAWVIDKGKTSGASPGFRINVAGKGKYLIKVTPDPERQVAATMIGEAVYYAAGYYASCEQAFRVRPSIFKLTKGLQYRDGNFGDLGPLDQARLDKVFAANMRSDGFLHISASAWVAGDTIGQFRYEGTRSDDPNDVIPHDDRRELRGARLLMAWIDHFDSREGNTLDTWLPDVKGAPPDSSPGHVVHYQIGTSAALGDTWAWDPISRRLGYSYILDWGDMAKDFASLGAVRHPWEDVELTPGQEIFGYMDVAHFDPETWKAEYSNAAFSRMTERDGAWMARIMARFTPEMVHALATMAKLTDPRNERYLEAVLLGRQRKILERYLTRLSPITGVHVEGTNTLCGVDLAEWRALWSPGAFRYRARWLGGGALKVERREGALVCVLLPHVAPDGRLADDARARYVRVRVEDGVARGPLVAHLYDLGPARGYRLVGLERPEL